jgi:hypothetical protein
MQNDEQLKSEGLVLRAGTKINDKLSVNIYDQSGEDYEFPQTYIGLQHHMFPDAEILLTKETFDKVADFLVGIKITF